MPLCDQLARRAPHYLAAGLGLKDHAEFVPSDTDQVGALDVDEPITPQERSSEK